MSKNNETNDVKKKRKKVDKSQLAIKVVALILAIAMIVPMIVSAIYTIVK